MTISVYYRVNDELIPDILVKRKRNNTKQESVGAKHK